MIIKDKVSLSVNVLFSGIGCQELGIKQTNLFNINVKCTSDINKDSILSYAILHHNLSKELIETYNYYPSFEIMCNELNSKNIGYDFKNNSPYDWKTVKSEFDLKKYWLATHLSNNLGDISKIQKLPYADLWTVSFPCTDISSSGKMQGFEFNSKTSSSLLWEQLRLLNVAKSNDELPKFILFENVKNLLSSLFIYSFKKFIELLNDLGYNCYYKIINSKDCGVPQGRERVYCICINKNIDNMKFTFPFSFDKGIRVSDILESNIEYDKAVAYYSPTNFNLNKICYNSHKIFPLLVENYDRYSNDRPNKIITLADIKSENDLVCSKSIKENLHQGNRIFDINGISPTITASGGGLGGNAGLFLIYDKNLDCYIIRKLVGIECYRLQGIYLDFSKVNAMQELGITDFMMCFQAGNGITTDVISVLFEHLYKNFYNNNYVCVDKLYSKVKFNKLF